MSKSPSMNELELMIDIETLGTRPGSVITEIAAAAFIPDTGEIVQIFQTEISTLDALAQGLTTDADTSAWHHRRGTNLNWTAPTLWSALCRLSLFIGQYPKARVWAWGMDFERPMLEAAYHLIHAPLPWDYYRSADARTAWALAYPGIKHPHRMHDALSDVRAQIRDLTQARNHLLQ